MNAQTLRTLRVVFILVVFSLCLPFTAICQGKIDKLIQDLRNEDPNVRYQAAVDLGEIKDPRAVEPLITALKDKDSKVRWRASEALRKIKDSRAVEPLIGALSDRDIVVRISAAEALGKIKDERAAEPLIALLSDKNWAVRQRAILSLEELGKTGERALMAVLRNEDLKTVASVYELFISKGIRDSEPVLIKALRRYGRTKMAQDFLNSGNSQLRNAACEWAESHGIQVIPWPGRPGMGAEAPRWGERR